MSIVKKSIMLSKTKKIIPNEFNCVLKTNSRCLISSSIFVLALGIFIHLLNISCFKYPGANYFIPVFIEFFLFVGFTYLGLLILLGENSFFTRRVRQLLLFAIIANIYTFATSAVQFTPFTPIDDKIIGLEAYFYINYAVIVEWTRTHLLVEAIMDAAYMSIAPTLVGIPFLLIVVGYTKYLKRYFFMMLSTCIIGFTIYFLLPTMAPASIINSEYFPLSQVATGFKFWQLHNYVVPTTYDGGMISLPSFHVIWSWCTLSLLKGLKVAYRIFFINHVLLVISCVLLGWHYITDIIASYIIIYVCLKLYDYLHLEKCSCST